jgi:hypothetical protein
MASAVAASTPSKLGQRVRRFRLFGAGITALATASGVAVAVAASDTTSRVLLGTACAGLLLVGLMGLFWPASRFRDLPDD